MRPLLIFLLFGMAFAACRQPNSITPDTLTGTWIEKSARQDTLIFNPTFQGRILVNTLTLIPIKMKLF